MARIQKAIRAALTMQRWPWEQGVVAQALLELGEKELTVLMAREAVVNQHKDGRLALKYDRNAATDPASNGEPVLFAAREMQDAKLMKAAEKMRDYLLYRAPRTREGIIFHNENEGRIWVDAFFMAPPFLAVAGCLEEALKQVLGYRKILWDSGKQLFHHHWDDDSKSFSRKFFWGVGNGWAAAGMSKVIRALPGAMKIEKAMIAGFVREVIDGCLRFQRPDGLFHDIVDDSSTFVETNLAQMLSYSIYRGVAGGWLDASYLRHADRMRERVYEKVDDSGLVQGVCAAPTFDYPGTAPEGQAFFLLMEAAYTDLNALK
jgi:unsaturated rhamnogalacturonyl hydrolase